MKHKCKAWGIFALVCFLTYLYGCQKEEFYEPKQFGPKEKTNAINFSYINGASNPKVVDMLTTQMRAARKLNSSNRNDESNYQTMSTTFGIVLFDNIMQVIDSIGNSNYTFKVLHDETSDTKFFNLVMSEKEEGVKVSLIKYEMNETFALLYKQGELDLSQFSGTVTTYTLTNPCMCELPDDGVPVLVTPGDSTGGDGGAGFGDPTGPSGGSNPSSGGTNVGCGLAIINTICCTGTHSGYNPSCLCANYGELPGSTFLVDTCTGEVLFQYNRNKGNNKENQNQTETYNQNNCCNNGVIGILDASTKETNLIEELIDDDNLDVCSKTILDQLKNLQQNDISKILQRFSIPYVYKLTFKTAIPLIEPINDAETDWLRDSNGNAINQNYLIHISPNYVNQATKIAIARTLLHELLHAHLLAIVDDIGQGDAIVNPRDFPIIYQAVLNATYDNSPNDLHHAQMAMKYIIPLRDALKEWDNNQQSSQYYEDLAWGALTSTSTFNVLHPLGSISRERIVSRNQAEDTNQVVNTPHISYIPMSLTCN